MIKLISKILLFVCLFQKIYCYQIDHIDYEDKQKLERFFKFLITRTSFGYTLCGKKPCSIYNNPTLSKLPPEYSVKILVKYMPYSLISEGWETWIKYATQFPSKNFVFRYAPKYNTFILINKSATKQAIYDNLDLFQKCSKSNLSVDEFLEIVCNPKDKDYLINYHTMLLGILLGYGRNNSIAFSQGSYIQKLKKFNLHDGYSYLNAILDPGFMAIQNGTNDKENDQIKKRFKQAKRNIESQFKTDQYFETFINLFTEDNQISQFNHSCNF